MCRSCVPEGETALPAASTSRRTFGRFLAAGAGLTVLSACTGSEPPGGAASSNFSSPAASPTPTASAPPEPAPTTPPAATSEPAPSPSAALAQLFSLTDPASPWLVVNKHKPLVPVDYAPRDLARPAVAASVAGEAALLNSTTAAAAEAMFAAAAQAGVTLVLASGYRSYGTQAATYNGYVAARGQADADTASARPGYSEHQTGWALDIADGAGACSFQPCFADQPAGAWARANGHRFGFVVRYPLMFHTITGYYYEPWHLRFIGEEAATDMVNRGIQTLEEYFGLPPAPGYL